MIYGVEFKIFRYFVVMIVVVQMKNVNASEKSGEVRVFFLNKVLPNEKINFKTL